jgi:hypothetical protein
MAEASKKFTIKPPLVIVLMADKETKHIRDIHFIFRDMDIGSLELKDGSLVLAEPDDESFKSIFKGDGADGLIQHIITIENSLSDERSFKLFHQLWGKAVGTEGYNKQEWKQLERVLRGLEYEE